MASVRFVGSGDAFGSGGRLQTCILVEDADWRCLIDCGTTSLIGMKAAQINPASIDVIIISHLHGDHFGGLPFWLLDAQLNNRRSSPLVIAGHPDLEERLRSTMELLFPGSQRALEVVAIDFVQLGPGAMTRIGAASVETFAVEHFCGSPPFAVRLTTPTGAIVTYSGDTEWTESLLDAARGADVFIAEAYFFEKKIKWHLDYATLAANLTRVTARRTIATHMSADVLSRLNELEVMAASDGLVLDL
jgi:ribonuclease BN (tRNA processing enzyme)